MTITWLVKKKEASAPVGLTFLSQNKIVKILKVQGRAAEKTDLIPGLVVSEICGQKVESATQATAIVKQATDEVRLVTNGKHHSATKVKSSEKAGISIGASTSFPGRIEISKVNPGGMFPDLVPGHILMAINGKQIKSVVQAIKLLKNKNSLRLVVVDPATMEGESEKMDEKPEMPVVAVEEPTPEEEAVEEPTPELADEEVVSVASASSLFTGVMSA